MRPWLYVPIVLSLLVLGAHFLRFANRFGVVIILVLVGMLLLRRAWVARLMQVVLLLGAFEWIRTLVLLAKMRAAIGEPATRLVIILGAVALLSAASALLFQTKALKRAYGLDRESE